jgi:uncharacterized protein (DUF1015 family)
VHGGFRENRGKQESIRNNDVMATIIPFRALRPNPLRADTLVFAEDKPDAALCEKCTRKAPLTLKGMLEAGARVRPEIPETQLNAYRQVNEKVEELLENGNLWREQVAGFYVYEIVHPKYRQTGIWALTDINDYATGRIKTHELIFPDSVRRLKNYREHTGLEGSPVLLTYSPTITINRIIAETRKKVNKQVLGDHNCFHRLWKIDDEPMKRKLSKAFAEIQSVYLADGHHRLAAAAKLKAKMREEGKIGFNTISSLYIATDQLRICEFNRVFVPDEVIDYPQFFKQLSEQFLIQERAGNGAFQSKKNNHIGMCAQGKWYDLYVKNIPSKGIAAKIDASILQQKILGPLLGVANPGPDTRLKCVGGAAALAGVSELLKKHPDGIAFTICALTTKQLIDVSDANEILPPKSTWIDPKVPYGLIMFK